MHVSARSCEIAHWWRWHTPRRLFASMSGVQPPAGEAQSVIQWARHHNEASSKARKLVRLFALGGFIACVYAVHVAFFWQWATVTSSLGYDATVGLEIKLHACDLDVRPGDAATITLAAGTQHARLNVISRSVAGASSVEITNPIDCARLPAQRCRSMCVATLVVPPAAAASSTFVVRQEEPKNWLVVDASEGIRVGHLQFGTPAEPMRLAYVHVRKLVAGSLSAHMVSGHLRADEATVGAVTFQSKEQRAAHSAPIPEHPVHRARAACTRLKPRAGACSDRACSGRACYRQRVGRRLPVQSRRAYGGGRAARIPAADAAPLPGDRPRGARGLSRALDGQHACKLVHHPRSTRGGGAPLRPQLERDRLAGRARRGPQADGPRRPGLEHAPHACIHVCIPHMYGMCMACAAGPRTCTPRTRAPLTGMVRARTETRRSAAATTARLRASALRSRRRTSASSPTRRRACTPPSSSTISSARTSRGHCQAASATRA